MINLKAIVLILPMLSSCANFSQRSPANIFDRDDRETLSLLSVPSVGRLMKDPNDKYLWGTAFHISKCHIVSAYHVVKDTSLVINSEDEAFFLSALKEKPIKAKPLAWGTPYEANLNENDWVILELEECVELDEKEIFSFSNYENINQLRGKPIELLGFPEDRHPKNIHIDRNCKFGDERPKAEDGIGHNCATRPGNSGGPLYRYNQESIREVSAIAVASRGYFVEIISGYSPWLANTGTPSEPIREAFERIIRHENLP